MSSRLSGGVQTLSAFIQRVLVALAPRYAGGTATSRALVIALTPSAQQSWTLDEHGTAVEQPQIREALASVPRPDVVNGPIAFAMLINLGQPFPTDGNPPVPPEWSEFASRASAA